MSRRIVFHCLAHGRYYRNCLIDYLLPSLLCEKNLDFFRSNEVTVLISSTPADWVVIQEHPVVRSSEKFVGFIFHPLSEGLLASKSNYRTAMLMAEAHRYGVEYCMRNEAVGSFLSPDMVVSDSFVWAIQDGIERGNSVVVAPAYRMTYLDAFINYFNEYRITKPAWTAQAQGYTGGELVRVGMRYTHPETYSFFFTPDTYLAYQDLRTPTASIFRHKIQADAVVGFGMSWFLTMIDFAHVASKERSQALKALEEHTIDAYFLSYLTRADVTKLFIVDDSTDCFVLSWDEGPNDAPRLQGPSRIDYTDKIKCDLIELGMASGIYDHLKVQLYQKPWFWHSPDTATDRNLSNYEIPSVFWSRFINAAPGNLKSGSLLTYVRLYRLLSNVPVRTSDPLTSSQGRFSTWLKGVYRRWGSIARRVYSSVKANLTDGKNLLVYLILFRRRIENPLNQATGGRALALIRHGTGRRFVDKRWKG